MDIFMVEDSTGDYQVVHLAEIYQMNLSPMLFIVPSSCLPITLFLLWLNKPT